MELKIEKLNTIASSLEIANNLLIYRDFEKCLSISLEQLNVIRRNNEVTSLAGLKESLCVVAIQAYAELDRWQEVLPYVTSVYTTLEEVPAQIIQLCILLHASVKDFLTCAALANVWLRNPKNTSSDLEDEYLETIDIYIGHVLIPANRWDDIQSFLESCPGLSSQRQDHFLKVIRTLRHQLDQLNAENIELVEVDSTNTNNRRATDENRSGKLDALSSSSRFLIYVHRVKKWISKNVPLLTLAMIKNISLMALLLYILITKTQLDLLSWPTLAKVWLMILHLWKRMFAPFYQSKTDSIAKV